MNLRISNIAGFPGNDELERTKGMLDDLMTNPAYWSGRTGELNYIFETTGGQRSKERMFHGINNVDKLKEVLSKGNVNSVIIATAEDWQRGQTHTLAMGGWPAIDKLRQYIVVNDEEIFELHDENIVNEVRGDVPTRLLPVNGYSSCVELDTTNMKVRAVCDCQTNILEVSK